MHETLHALMADAQYVNFIPYSNVSPYLKLFACEILCWKVGLRPHTLSTDSGEGGVEFHID